jgi:ATP-dependent DNA helicase RecQ
VDEGRKEKGAAPGKGVGDVEDFDTDLFETLRKKRKSLADEANLPPYAIFHDRTLREMAASYPRTPESLLALYGVGQRKLEKYAAAFLEIIEGHCRTRRIPERQEPGL